MTPSPFVKKENRKISVVSSLNLPYDRLSYVNTSRSIPVYQLYIIKDVFSLLIDFSNQKKMVDRCLLFLFFAVTLFVSGLHAERARNDNLQNEEIDFTSDNTNVEGDSRNYLN